MDARERLILRRETHLDRLADKLREPRVQRVQRVIEPLLSGGGEEAAIGDLEFDLDVEYVRDLGLIAHDMPVRVANPVYAEVLPRMLTVAAQRRLERDPAHDAARYVDAGGGLNLVKLLEAFQLFFRAHSEHCIGRFAYREAGPQLLLQAFLQRIVNGGGRIERE